MFADTITGEQELMKVQLPWLVAGAVGMVAFGPDRPAKEVTFLKRPLAFFSASFSR